jgi:hypothetical protein
MIQIDSCTTCPNCGNGSLSEVKVYLNKNVLGLTYKKYSHTKQVCLFNYKTSMGICNYDSDNTLDVIRDNKLQTLLDQ